MRYASLVSEGVEAGDVDSFIDTGSYTLNGLTIRFSLWWSGNKKQDNCLIAGEDGC